MHDNLTIDRLYHNYSASTAAIICKPFAGEHYFKADLRDVRPAEDLIDPVVNIDRFNDLNFAVPIALHNGIEILYFHEVTADGKLHVSYLGTMDPQLPKFYMAGAFVQAVFPDDELAMRFTGTEVFEIEAGTHEEVYVDDHPGVQVPLAKKLTVGLEALAVLNETKQLPDCGDNIVNLNLYKRPKNPT